MTRVQGQRKFTNSVEGFISGKLPMAEDKVCMFVEYTIIAIVYDIYYGSVILVRYNIRNNFWLCCIMILPLCQAFVR